MAEPSNPQRVVVLGASDREERYSCQALQMLAEYGHEAVPIHPRLERILGKKVLPDLNAVEGEVDTLTLYVNAGISDGLIEEIIALHPGRVIFNPGTENPSLAGKLDAAGIPTQEACTLVLLRTGQF